MFTKEQAEQIVLGQAENLDVSLYAKEEIDAFDMRFIRKCLQGNFLETAKGYAIFTKEQKLVLIEGIKKDVDIKKVADKAYSPEQMTQLVLGLEDNLDISIYAKPDYNDRVMEFMRNSLKNKNILYKMVEIIGANNIDSYYFRERVKYAMEAMNLNLNMDKYLLDANFDIYQIRQILRGLKHDVDVSIYAKNYIPSDIMRTIRHALEKNIDINITCIPNYWQYNNYALKEIINGIEEGLDVSYYANLKFDPHQMHQIKLGLLEKVDVSIYNKPEISNQKMRIIRTYLNEGVNLCQYIDKCSEVKLEEIGRAISEGIDVSKYISNKYTGKDITYLIIGTKYNIDMTPYLGKGFDDKQLSQIYDGLKKEIDVSIFAKPEYEWTRMRLIINNYFSGLDISVLTDISIDTDQLSYIIKIYDNYGINMYSYVKRKFGPGQLNLILEGLRSHIDVSLYAKKSYKIAKMEAILKDLIAQKNKKNSV